MKEQRGLCQISCGEMLMQSWPEYSGAIDSTLSPEELDELIRKQNPRIELPPIVPVSLLDQSLSTREIEE